MIIYYGKAIWRVIFIVCNTNQYGLSTTSVLNMQQESIWHTFLFCNICDKKCYGVTFVFSVKYSTKYGISSCS